MTKQRAHRLRTLRGQGVELTPDEADDLSYWDQHHSRRRRPAPTIVSRPDPDPSSGVRADVETWTGPGTQGPPSMVPDGPGLARSPGHAPPPPPLDFTVAEPAKQVVPDEQRVEMAKKFSVVCKKGLDEWGTWIRDQGGQPCPAFVVDSFFVPATTAIGYRSMPREIDPDMGHGLQWGIVAGVLLWMGGVSIYLVRSRGQREIPGAEDLLGTPPAPPPPSDSERAQREAALRAFGTDP